jgi:hypothetical protein
VNLVDEFAFYIRLIVMKFMFGKTFFQCFEKIFERKVSVDRYFES